MAPSARSIACFALLVSISALQVPSSFIDHRGTTTTTTAAATTSASAFTSAPPPLFDDGALKAAMALAGMDALLIAAAVIYSRHTHHAAVGAGGGGNWRISELVFFTLCLQVGVLQFVLFVEPVAAGDAARALGSSAARALPCVASATFLMGITLIYAHVGNGGGAAGGAAPVPAPATATVRLLANMTLGAALACLMSIVLVYISEN